MAEYFDSICSSWLFADLPDDGVPVFAPGAVWDAAVASYVSNVKFNWVVDSGIAVIDSIQAECFSGIECTLGELNVIRQEAGRLRTELSFEGCPVKTLDGDRFLVSALLLRLQIDHLNLNVIRIGMGALNDFYPQLSL